MNLKLRKKLNAQLQWLVSNAANRIKPGVRRLAVVWESCRVMFDKARSQEERDFWRQYMRQLETKADQLKSKEDDRERQYPKSRLWRPN